MYKWINGRIVIYLVLIEFSVFVLGERGDNCMVLSFLKSTKYLIALTFWDQRSYY